MSKQKDLIFLLGIAESRGWYSLMRAINLALEGHRGQTRLGGEEYITHPTHVAKFLYLLGVEDEDILTGAVLHDFPEDCKADQKKMTERRINERPIKWP